MTRIGKGYIEPDDVAGKPYIFVSYSRKDKDDVQDFLRMLRRNRFRFWYDRGLKSGVEWAEEIGDKIDHCDQFMVLISDNAVKSRYVHKEVGMATNQGKNISVVYLAPTKLTSGLQLLLSDIHAIHREEYENIDEFEKAVCKSVSRNVFYSTQLNFDGQQQNASEGAEKKFLENYELLSQIGQGGLSVVYSARQKRTGNLVVVKCGNIDRSFLGMMLPAVFKSEKKVLSEIPFVGCPYLPMLLDWYQDEKQIFLVENYIQGTSLKMRGPLLEQEVVEIARKVLSILVCLHRSHIAHLDIKPSNLIMDQWKNVYLIDFNSAVILSGGHREHYLTSTPGYSPPEQLKKLSAVSFSSDIYALGRTMKYLLFPQIEESAPIRMYRPDVSVELEDVIRRMTEPLYTQRIQSAALLLEMLKRYESRNIFKKAKLWWKSNQRSRDYMMREKHDLKQRDAMIQEMANITTELIGVDSGQTVLVHPSSLDGTNILNSPGMPLFDDHDTIL